MRTFNTFMKALVFVIPLAIAIAGKSQNAPMGCDSKFFISYGSSNGPASTTTVNQLTVTGSSVTGAAFPTDPTAIGYNGIGLNPIDGYMYGMRYPASNERVRLVRIGAGTPGNVTDLGEVKNASGTNLQDEVIVYAGCFDAAGTYYFVTTNDRLFSLSNSELGNGAGQRDATFIANITIPDYIVDIAIDPTDGQMYGVSTGSDYGVYTINKATGAAVRLGTYPNSNSPMIGLFFTENGNLYSYRSNGAFFLLNKTNGSGTSVGTGPSYSFADGCSCSFRVAHDLNAPTAICPTIANGGQPAFDFTLSIQNLSSAARTGTTYTLVLSNRFSFTQSATTIAANFAVAGLTNSGAVISSVSGGTNNQLVVNNMTVPNLSVVPNVLIGAKLINHIGFLTATFQSTISGLPAGLGGSDLSNDPKTPTPDDATIIGRCPGIPLAVKLLSFSGNYKNNTTLLNWQTEGEVNFDHFEIERSSNGADFYNIGNEVAKGTASTKQNYSHADNLVTVNGDVFYYRLKIVDKDGTFTYSSIVLVRKDQKMTTGITINPNPVITGSVATVRFNAANTGKVDLRIMDMAGKTVLQQQANIFEGSNNISLNNLSKLLPGVYVLQLSNGEEQNIVKFTIGR
ncbi:MAG: T9SS type A sorting domain-containing protein [Bacteroidota bacterium]|nr:T9SS type A sorting domain-containing protein [Bacteroidota bacterium]